MERLWAPWRLSYITGEGADPSATPPEKGCIFCDKPAEDRDENNLIIARGATCFVILNAFPYTNGHLMIVPYRHLSHPAGLTSHENAELMITASHLTTVLDHVYRPDGYNMGMNIGSAAGAGIAAHLHLHLVPRWGGDTNFMPVIGNVKVMPETLEQTFQKVRAALTEMRAANPDQTDQTISKE